MSIVLPVVDEGSIAVLAVEVIVEAGLGVVIDSLACAERVESVISGVVDAVSKVELAAGVDSAVDCEVKMEE